MKFTKIDHPAVSFDDYINLLDPRLVQELRSVAANMGHLKVVHINSTATGGGVAEILQSMVPLSNALGIETERIVIDPGEPEFFQVTKKIHNLLQGAEGALSDHELQVYFSCLEEVASDIREGGLAAHVWVLHDPQLLPMARLLPRSPNEVWVWVCHIDLTTPNQGAMDVLLPLTQEYDQLIFSQEAYVPSGLSQTVPVSIAPPAIDPLTEKNQALDVATAWKIVEGMGLDPNRPLITQVSRFDMWKDPWGVVDSYRIARESVPGLQLALLGLSQATDDPEALDVLNSVREHAGGDPDIHLFYDPSDLKQSIDTTVNAIQVASDVLMQKSTREGFGLTITEGMWKGKPVIGGDAGGIRIQIEDGVSGYLVSSPSECGQRIVELMQDADLRASIGEASKESVRQRFLLPRLALDYLRAAEAHIRPGAGLTNGDRPKSAGFQELIPWVVAQEVRQTT